MKPIKEYSKMVNSAPLPNYRGQQVNDEELVFRPKTPDILCHFHAGWQGVFTTAVSQISESLGEIENGGLVRISDAGVGVTDPGLAIVRNVYTCFNMRLIQNKPSTRIFSQVV